MEVEVASQNSLHEVCLQTAADWGWQRSRPPSLASVAPETPAVAPTAAEVLPAFRHQPLPRFL